MTMPGAPEEKSNEQIVEECNELARMFYRSLGYVVPKGYRFDRASHPQELAVWRQAAMAFEFLTDTDPDNALSELEEDDPDLIPLKDAMGKPKTRKGKGRKGR